jgi:hypothetical protein
VEGFSYRLNAQRETRRFSGVGSTLLFGASLFCLVAASSMSTRQSRHYVPVSFRRGCLLLSGADEIICVGGGLLA